MIEIECFDSAVKQERTDAVISERDTREFVPILTRGLRHPGSRIIMAAASCAFLIGVSIKLIDRPVAMWVHQHLVVSRVAWFATSYDSHSLPISPFSLMTAPAEVLRPFALVVFLLCVLAAAIGWRAKKRGRIALALSLSILVGMNINAKAQSAFGRTWPESWLGSNESWIRDGVFGFFPFHGGAGWESFPSGHTTATTAPATLLWVVWPELRPLWVTIVLIDMTGLLGANYHFVSDIIGGVYIGIASGLGMAALMLSPMDRVGRPVVEIAHPTEQIAPGIDASQSTATHA